MSLPGNGIFVVRGELATLMTAMRRGARWSSHSHQDDDLDGLGRTLQDLKTVLNKVDDLRVLEPSVYLGPFLEVIRSEETTGPVTSLALSAVNKFLSYGLIGRSSNFQIGTGKWTGFVCRSRARGGAVDGSQYRRCRDSRPFRRNGSIVRCRCVDENPPGIADAHVGSGRCFFDQREPVRNYAVLFSNSVRD